MGPVQIYTQPAIAQAWLDRYRGYQPLFACVLGFTETGLIPGISAAGATPSDRKHTAIADAEFLYHGVQYSPHYPLPPLQAGASPVLVSRAVIEAQAIPVSIFNAGLPYYLPVPHVDLDGQSARCVSSGNALDIETVHRVFNHGMAWGHQLANASDGYMMMGECVVGGTTTALAVLTGLGWSADGKINSSHPTCNHQQKWEVVNTGLQRFAQSTQKKTGIGIPDPDPFDVIAAVGDPMQVAVAGMAIAASRSCGVLLAGGTQMLAVYALIRAIAAYHALDGHPSRVVVGTTRWVANDPTGDTVGLARDLQAPLLATQLSFATSRYAQLQAYERGYVKEGVGAGGCAIAASLYQGWNTDQLLAAIETLAERYDRGRTRYED
ncbi:MAG TPA: nicotinate mononucleotide-dependent phosphoribosyltransferase CobT [Elainellaceae cyanobacterium]